MPARGRTHARAEARIRHLFRHPNGAKLLVDSDLWLCALDLAVLNGWRPLGTLPIETGKSGPWNAYAYFVPGDRQIVDDDAQELARCLEDALTLVPDAIVPMQGAAFGDENTLALIVNAAEGATIAEEKTTAAREILSGPPKSEMRDLIQFLRAGGFTIHSTAATPLR